MSYINNKRGKLYIYGKLLLYRGNKMSEEQKDVVENLSKTFYAFVEALEPFKNVDKKKRKEIIKEIREKIHPQDVGYAISFIKALFNEDEFADFIYFSNYKIKKL